MKASKAVYMLLLICMFFGFAAFVFTMRTLRWHAKQSQLPPQPVFQVADLRAMQKAGTLTAEEFERLSAAILRTENALSPPPRQRGFDVLPPGGK